MPVSKRCRRVGLQLCRLQQRDRPTNVALFGLLLLKPKRRALRSVSTRDHRLRVAALWRSVQRAVQLHPESRLVQRRVRLQRQRHNITADMNTCPTLLEHLKCLLRVLGPDTTYRTPVSTNASYRTQTRFNNNSSRWRLRPTKSTPT